MGSTSDFDGKPIQIDSLLWDESNKEPNRPIGFLEFFIYMYIIDMQILRNGHKHPSLGMIQPVEHTTKPNPLAVLNYTN